MTLHSLAIPSSGVNEAGAVWELSILNFCCNNSNIDFCQFLFAAMQAVLLIDNFCFILQME